MNSFFHGLGRLLSSPSIDLNKKNDKDKIKNNNNNLDCDIDNEPIDADSTDGQQKTKTPIMQLPQQQRSQTRPQTQQTQASPLLQPQKQIRLNKTFFVQTLKFGTSMFTGCSLEVESDLLRFQFKRESCSHMEEVKVFHNEIKSITLREQNVFSIQGIYRLNRNRDKPEDGVVLFSVSSHNGPDLINELRSLHITMISERQGAQSVLEELGVPDKPVPPKRVLPFQSSSSSSSSPWITKLTSSSTSTSSTSSTASSSFNKEKDKGITAYLNITTVSRSPPPTAAPQPVAVSRPKPPAPVPKPTLHVSGDEPMIRYPPSKPTETKPVGQVTITRKDMKRLSNEEFLNDSIIEFYTKYINDHFLHPDHSFFFFNSFFYKKLTSFPLGEAHKHVIKWTKNEDIFQKDFIFIPINQ
ncbi:hypothetical protein SAMD00019534_084810 [Acytostelium subglobosum LB1]|uniref:hypothetical protein n=1 Tax=Acytostelium subglobosum LB1 TaxID=1410327 RepID=UPI0006449DB1|nr:hypothetical protein SAMD00019534_084810 [Acytostelium subglobosum LB1]GAM25306.1 hypothetical protein SAMD00019534_084810 [Acytostelium subglobosum LB1]|eukprot:XP_012751826.1 hypothetical protein SAMD00019534_084810 [Acytostelium subglobosum LB1]